MRFAININLPVDAYFTIGFDANLYRAIFCPNSFVAGVINAA